MPEWIVPLSDLRYEPAEIDAVADAYRSGWLSQGPAVAAFEAAFAAQLTSPEPLHAVAVASGTAALHLICAALDLAAGDEVVLPALTFAATAATVVHVGARPVFADICDSDRPWLSVEAARAAITPRTRAIVTVAYGGHPGEVLALRALADEHGIALVEDAAHAVGARVAGRAVGTIGVAGAFSFFANKNLPLGEGGMLITPDPQLAERIRRLRSHGLSTGTWERHTTAAAGGYEVSEPGFNYRLDEPRAALGRLLLRRLHGDNALRAECAARYAAALAAVPGVEPVLRPEPGVQSAWHIYPVLLGPQVDRARFRAKLQAAGVQTSVHYPPLHRTRAFAGSDPTALPATEAYARRTVTLPLFPHLTATQQAHVTDAVARAASADLDAVGPRR